MQITFQLDTNELSNNLLESIKKAFAGKKINILVTEVDEEYNPAFVEKVKKASESKVRYVFHGDDFANFTNQLIANEPINSEQYKTIVSE
jgi:hypothetical protein